MADARHILIVHSDQHRYDCVAANGHPQLRTPAMDRLAGEGVNFTHAYTPTPICSPARASLVTGRWPTQHGCINIPGTESYHPGAAAGNLWGMLHEAGYQVGHVGKYHAELPGTPRDHGADDYIDPGAYPAWREGLGLPAYAPMRNGWFGCVDAAPAEQSRLHWQADRTIDLLRKYHADGRPFFLRWDPPEPHLPCVPVEPYASMYPSASIEPWPSFPDELAGKPFAQAQVRRNWKLAHWTWDDWAPVVSRYLAVITELDANLGRVLETLDELGLADDTLVIYTTDHGDMCGGHGMMDKHFNMYDDIVRVPMMMRWPGRVPAGGACDAFVIHELDMATTVCEAAGLDVPETFEGRSLTAMVSGDDPEPRTEAYSMYQGAQQGLYSCRMVRDHEWKYVFNPSAVDELYHLPSDPGELRNRIDDPAAAEELKRLRGRMLTNMQAIRDPLLNPWMRAQLETE